MKSFSLGFRLFLNILIFSIPVVVLTMLMYRSESVNIDFSTKEKDGSLLQKPYEGLLQVLYHYNALGSDAKNPELDKQLETFMAQVETQHNLYQEELQFTTEGLGSRQREKAGLDFLKEAVKKRNWSDAIDSVKLSVTHLGDTSNLILDPDLDSYYMMDMTLLALPQFVDRMHTIVIGLKTMTPVQAAVHSSMLNEADLARLQADAKTTINEDKNFYGVSDSLQQKVPTEIESLGKGVEEFRGLLNKVAAGEVVAPELLQEKGLALMDHGFSTWRVLSAEMDVLLDKRVDTLTAGRMKSLVLSGVALMLAIFFSIYIGASLSQTIANMLKSIRELKNAAKETLTRGSQLADTSRLVTDSVTSKAAALEETSAAVVEISSMANFSAESSSKASGMASSVTHSAQSGATQIEKLLAYMNEISASSKKIAETITVIDDIAFQTNLLALNASVEAARAGEAGRGFAVVADAVRSLAQKSAVSAKEINDLVKNNVGVIENGRKGTSEFADVLGQITKTVKDLNQLNNEIASAAREQATGIQQISTSINELDGESQKNQHSMMQVSESAEALLKQSKILDNIIYVLECELRGKSKVDAENKVVDFVAPSSEDLRARAS